MTSDDEERHPEPEELTAVRELGPGNTGTWVITTQHSRHILDLDRQTYRREPGPDGTPMLHDDRTVALTRIQQWPTVGGIQLVWFDDPEVPELLEHWRQSSTITDISPLPTTDALLDDWPASGTGHPTSLSP